MQKLRDYQERFLVDATEFFNSAKPGASRLYSSPTGTGKSVMELALLQRFPDTVLITPSIGIINGMLQKLGSPAADGSEATVLAAAESLGIWTPVRFRNRLADAVVNRPKRLIIDEAHHDLANVYQEIHAMCADRPKVGLSATCFRGTPKATAAFREQWGEPVVILSISAAVKGGYLAMPSVSVLPLVDDDKIEVVNGEIKVQAASEAVKSRIDDIANHCRRFFSAGLFDIPTMVSLPSVDCVEVAEVFFHAKGLPFVSVTGEVGYADRTDAFTKCINRQAILLQIRVVSEGVDLPIRRLIDCSPTLSPVLWLQQFGRITRPWDQQPQYICTNRNLERHCYLLEGFVPPEAVAAAQQGFNGPSQRAGQRVIGLEALGRFKPTTVRLRDGQSVTMYSISSIEANMKVDYAAILHPRYPDVVYAKRESTRTGGVTVGYGKWELIQKLPDLTGFSSAPGSPVTPKQKAWWERAAGNFGIDSTVEPTRRQFALLPILNDLKMGF